MARARIDEGTEGNFGTQRDSGTAVPVQYRSLSPDMQSVTIESERRATDLAALSIGGSRTEPTVTLEQTPQIAAGSPVNQGTAGGGGYGSASVPATSIAATSVVGADSVGSDSQKAFLGIPPIGWVVILTLALLAGES